MVCLFLCDNFILGFPEKQNQHNVCVCMCVYFEELAYVTYRGLQVQNVLGWPAAWRPREGLMLQIKFAFILIDILCLILCVSWFLHQTRKSLVSISSHILLPLSLSPLLLRLPLFVCCYAWWCCTAFQRLHLFFFRFFLFLILDYLLLSPSTEFFISISFNTFWLQNFCWYFLTIFFKYYFLAVVGLHCCVQAFSICGKQGLLIVVVCGLLIAAASPVAEHRL